MTTMQLDKSTGTPPAQAAACAKINLSLDILKTRDDGFHELRSLVVGVDLCDRIRCTVAPGEGLGISCDNREIPDTDNLAYRAAGLLAARCSVAPDLKIELAKKIPVGAGLGGGSSDAATALRLCNELWATGLDRSSLARLGGELGSDVPLFFSLPSAVLEGRGERVESVKMRWSGWVLLVFAGATVSTAEVYRAWRRGDGARMASGEEEAIVEAGSAREIATLASNHLEPAVFRTSPAVASVCEKLTKLEVCPVRVSGAGSTLFMLFDELAAAREVARLVDGNGIGRGTAVVRAPHDEPVITRKEHTDGDFRRPRRVGRESF